MLHAARTVVPAKAGTQRLCSGATESHWVPAFARTTEVSVIARSELTKHDTNG
jgi:hypothetical protein